MKILFVASEAEPYAKSGGLADVVSSLSKALAIKGCDVKVIIPLYKTIDYKKYSLKPLASNLCVHMGGCEEWFSVHLANNRFVNFYFIEFNKYFYRNGFYHDENGEFGDNLERFAFFCKAAMQLSKDLDFKPDIVHVHDWQTSLIPYYIKQSYEPYFNETKSILTIHNMGYQGVFDKKSMNYSMLKEEDFIESKFEAFGMVNLLKCGVVFSDELTTVSPTYSEEIKGEIGGYGLNKYLMSRSNHLSGILNGVDTEIWNPSSDVYLAENFSISNVKYGKAKNKLELQKRFNLELNPNIPLFIVISRFAEQKGLWLIRDIAGNMLSNMRCQLIVIGAGDRELERYFGDLPKYFSSMNSYIGYSEELAHLAEAGADFFIMPSLYEPCGLNQMYSQIYGTLPLVRSVGGLADTVDQYDEKTGSGTGFKFYDMSSLALYNTIGWAVSTYFDRPVHFEMMRLAAMKKDFSWDISAEKYTFIYRKMINSK